MTRSVVIHHGLDTKEPANCSLIKAESYVSSLSIWLNPVQEGQRSTTSPDTIRTQGEVWQQMQAARQGQGYKYTQVDLGLTGHDGR